MVDLVRSHNINFIKKSDGLILLLTIDDSFDIAIFAKYFSFSKKGYEELKNFLEGVGR
jgi:hypothetical protein